MKKSGRLAFEGQIEAAEDDDDFDHDPVATDVVTNKKHYSSTNMYDASPEGIGLLKTFYSANHGNDENTSTNFPVQVRYVQMHCEDVSGCTIEWGGGGGREKESSQNRVSSVVALKLERGEPLFGQIRHFIDHDYCGTMTRFAVIDLFQDTRLDKIAHLWWVHCTTTDMHIVPATFRYISRPLVTAKCKDKDQMCILNY